MCAWRVRLSTILGLGLAVAACAPPTYPPSATSHTGTPLPWVGHESEEPSMPVAHLGPDVKLRVLCGGEAKGAVASVDERGPGSTTWTTTLAGDRAFVIDESPRTANPGAASVATIKLIPPPTAVPGDTFDGIVTVSAEKDAFSAGTVAVHGEVVRPTVIVDETTIDFGDVPEGVIAERRLVFRDYDDPGIYFSAPGTSLLPFWSVFDTPKPNTFAFIVSVAGPPGDYALDATWTASWQGLGGLDACLWTQTIRLRARIVPSTDGGAD